MSFRQILMMKRSYISPLWMVIVEVPYPDSLLCCHQITEEAMNMLYGGNIFQVNIHGDGQFTFAHLFNSKTREKIRKMVLILRPMGVSYHLDFRMDPNIPYDFCDDWIRVGDGEWVTITTAKGVLCQFGRHLLCDTIIGLYHCGRGISWANFKKLHMNLA